MKTLINKKTMKNLIIIMAIITILSALVPKGCQAATDTANGGKLFTPISDFVLFICDSIMGWLQNTLVTPEDIEVSDNVWEFKYSPAIIFSGEVPALDINFINPGEDVTVTVTEEIDKENIDIEQIKADNYSHTPENDNVWKDFIKSLNVDYFELVDQGTSWLGPNRRDWSSKYGMYSNNLHYINGSEATSITEKSDKNSIYNVSKHLRVRDDKLEEIHFWVSDGVLYMYQFYDTSWTIKNEWFLYKCELNIDEEGDYFITSVTKTYKNTAKALQPTIATWYNTLRKIALVGLLSVLVYVGIRIVMTSSSSDKAKYKAMLKDWLVALCLLFTLHYIMSITITVTNEISNIFQSGESDVLLNTLREKIFGEKDRAVIFANTIMYAMLTILTVVYTIQYLKRVIFMAFYTLIAPLITLTYPLDKIKDGQAQAFNLWIREYIYTALVQVIHLVIYTVLVGSALGLVADYPLYAIVVLMFIKKADGIVKKMFGFDKNSETVGLLGAAASGALVVNALSKIGGKGGPKKDSSEGKSNESGAGNIRTASNTSFNDSLTSLRGEGDITLPAKTGNAKKGTGAVIKKYTKPVLGSIAGTATSVAGGMIGFAAGAVNGDLTSAFAGMTAGRKAGKNIGNNAINLGADILNSQKTAQNAINSLKDVYNEEAYGTAYAENIKEIREFKGSSEYKALKDKHGDKFTDDKLSVMLQAGIKEKGDIDNILQSNNISDAIGYYTLAKKCPDSIYYDDDKLQQYLEDLDISKTDAKIMRENMRKYR